MSEHSYSIVNNATGDKVDLPVKQGTLGPVGLDVGKLYANTGSFTFDPGFTSCLLYTSPSPRDQRGSRMPSSA